MNCNCNLSLCPSFSPITSAARACLRQRHRLSAVVTSDVRLLPWINKDVFTDFFMSDFNNARFRATLQFRHSLAG